MKRVRILIVLSVFTLAVGASAQQDKAPVKVVAPAPVAAPRPADGVLTAAESDAKASGKNVLVIFHASWCGWCKRLDAFMNDERFKPIFDQNFVTVKLTVLEDDAHKALENPGGLEEMDQLGGRNAGLPLFAILDPDGKTIVTSMRPVEGSDKAENTGYPSKPEEVDYFLTMMQKGAPKITADQMDAMKAFLTAPPATQGSKPAAGGGGGH